ncbi:hypothetical protein GUITHDRAFT_146391 [Guillardia theta CCMP2712]|uniref:Protein kinase domain-containing protein n=1 Tax=Guillardia theta (strain CCMP2712) TaxID=905079 RepID=L1IH26_GUITC|nr:hypothetical protein GUITHDRAFT_146391 [Guillardia theta CCMP2712]EKX35561.1 hypothetical protein GUITHDRAFT_146391 [Guillardia theta CCMP2712]|eukprot:XP_005822541.1 hypothetical protein GUITHDRAFT_146391 [Guillardia theta CCMP2712]
MLSEGVAQEAEVKSWSQEDELEDQLLFDDLFPTRPGRDHSRILLDLGEVRGERQKGHHWGDEDMEEDFIRLCSASMAKWRLLEDSRTHHDAQSSSWGPEAQDLAQLTHAALATEVLKRESGRKKDLEKRHPHDAHELEAWRELAGEHEQEELEVLKDSRQRSLLGGNLDYEKLYLMPQCTYSKVYVGRFKGKESKTVAIRELDLQEYWVDHKVRCYGGSYSRQEQVVVVVDELMDAGSLQGLIAYLWHERQKTWQEEERLMEETAIRKIMAAILHGLNHLHSNGIVHGRLKVRQTLRLSSELILLFSPPS